MTPMFLNSHFFGCQKKDTHKWSVSTAIKWIIKNQIADNSTKSIRYRRKLHVSLKYLSARKLKVLLKEYMIKEDNELDIFGHIINLSNRMFLIITYFILIFLDPSLFLSKQLLQGHWWNITSLLKKYVISLIQEGYSFKSDQDLVLPFKIWIDGCSIKNHQLLKVI